MQQARQFLVARPGKIYVFWKMEPGARSVAFLEIAAICRPGFVPDRGLVRDINGTGAQIEHPFSRPAWEFCNQRSTGTRNSSWSSDELSKVRRAPGLRYCGSLTRRPGSAQQFGSRDGFIVTPRRLPASQAWTNAQKKRLSTRPN